MSPRVSRGVKSYAGAEARAIINANLTGNLLVQVPPVFSFPGLRICLLRSFSCSLTVVSDSSCSPFIHFFPHSFTHSSSNISWCPKHSRQWCFSCLGFLWGNCGCLHSHRVDVSVLGSRDSLLENSSNRS